MMERLNRFAAAHRLALCAMLALALSGALALCNVSSGPLSNLNDIGGWNNRALFIAMAAAAHAALLILCAALSRVNLARTALRQIIVTAGMFILLLPINIKAYAYVEVMQPVIRAMDAGGLAAGIPLASGVSAPMLTLLYLITRGPVYDMYLLKLFALCAFMLLALLGVRWADKRGMGLRAEALLALGMILPQGLMNAACSALPEIAAAALLALALTLLGEKKAHAAGLVYGLACALCGAALYALPVYALALRRGAMKPRDLAAGAGVMLALCVPAVACGMPVTEALGSLFAANLALPAYASGAPGIFSLIPRAAIEEIPQYASTLRYMHELDFVTNAQRFYTQEHFIIAMRGMCVAGIAAYMGVCALVFRMKDKTALHRAMTLVLGALMICPNLSSGAWLAADMLCLLAILAEKKLRLPACLVLFATMCTGAYPMTQESMLPMIYAFGLCLCAWLMLADVIPVIPTGKEEHDE